MKIADIRKVYCIGLGGVGVSAVAKYFLAHGVTVAGSDPQRNPLIDDLVRAGVEYFSDETPSHLSPDTDLVVYTDDARPDHPLRRRAEELKLKAQNFSATLGEIMLTSAKRVCVAGTNGKSTTTALTGLLLERADLHPTVFVGSRVSQFDGNLRIGDGGIFVAESDEYRDHFLNLSPTIALITNIELDHLDYFPNLKRLEKSFLQFGQLLPPDGALITNADDPVSRKIFGGHPRQATFGLSADAELRATGIQLSAGRQDFSVTWRGQSLGRFTLHLPGQFNVMNALAAMAAALSAGADPATFHQTVAEFHGVWRRFEILNPTSTVTVINDYAHHPTAVRGTLEGARAFYPDRRIVAVFQPHHHNRLTKLFDGFASSFQAADVRVIVETYTVPGREPQTADIKTGRDLVKALNHQEQPASYASDPVAAQAQLKTILRPGDVVVIMGAGDIWRIAQPLADHYA